MCGGQFHEHRPGGLSEAELSSLAPAPVRARVQLQVRHIATWQLRTLELSMYTSMTPVWTTKNSVASSPCLMIVTPAGTVSGSIRSITRSMSSTLSDANRMFLRFSADEIAPTADGVFGNTATLRRKRQGNRHGQTIHFCCCRPHPHVT